MEKNRKLTELKNIGSKIAERLNEIGIYSENELRIMGAVKAHRMLKEKFPNDVFPVCYYLYSFEGALNDKHWSEIETEKKCELKSEISVAHG